MGGEGGKAEGAAAMREGPVQASWVSRLSVEARWETGSRYAVGRDGDGGGGLRGCCRCCCLWRCLAAPRAVSRAAEESFLHRRKGDGESQGGEEASPCPQLVRRELRVVSLFLFLLTPAQSLLCQPRNNSSSSPARNTRLLDSQAPSAATLPPAAATSHDPNLIPPPLRLTQKKAPPVYSPLPLPPLPPLGRHSPSSAQASSRISSIMVWSRTYCCCAIPLCE